MIDDTPKILSDLGRFIKPYWVEVGSGGSGIEPFDRWVHCDPFINYERHHIEIQCYAWKLPFENTSVEKIYARGVWEHFSYKQCDKVMNEFLRVLVSNGSIEFNFPPIDNYIERYNKKEIDWEFLIHALYGWQIFHEDCHLSGWTDSMVKNFLNKYADKFSLIKVYPGYSLMDGKPIEVETYDSWDAGIHGWVKLIKK